MRTTPRRSESPMALTLCSVVAPLQPMKSLLIAEGNASVAKLFASVFEQHQWKVTSPPDANGVREALRGTEPFDIMLVSYEVRGSNGLELIKLVRALDHRRHLPVLLVTGTSGIDAEAFAAGASDVLHKPVDIYSLINAVNRQVARAEHHNSKG